MPRPVPNGPIVPDALVVLPPRRPPLRRGLSLPAVRSARPRLLPGAEPARFALGGVPEWPIGTALKAVAGRDVSRGFESRPLCQELEQALTGVSVER